MYLGALAGDLGFFPLDYRAYPLQSYSRAHHNSIRSLIGFGIPVRTLAHSVALPLLLIHEAIPKYISRRTSYYPV